VRTIGTDVEEGGEQSRPAGEVHSGGDRCGGADSKPGVGNVRAAGGCWDRQISYGSS